MIGMHWILELALVGLLLATVFHAIRLERALGVLKRDRIALEALVAGFNDATEAADKGIARLRETAEGTGRQLARQSETALQLKDDLVFLQERGGVLADRLDSLVRNSRAVAPVAALPSALPRLRAVESAEVEPEPAMAGGQGAVRPRSQAERDLIRALRLTR